jgi:hypothetical protein
VLVDDEPSADRVVGALLQHAAAGLEGPEDHAVRRAGSSTGVGSDDVTSEPGNRRHPVGQSVTRGGVCGARTRALARAVGRLPSRPQRDERSSMFCTSRPSARRCRRRPAYGTGGFCRPRTAARRGTLTKPALSYATQAWKRQPAAFCRRTQSANCRWADAVRSGPMTLMTKRRLR